MPCPDTRDQYSVLKMTNVDVGLDLAANLRRVAHKRTTLVVSYLLGQTVFDTEPNVVAGQSSNVIFIRKGSDGYSTG